MLKRKEGIVQFFSVLQQLISMNSPHKLIEETAKELSEAYKLQYDEVITLYNKLALFQIDIKELGGIEKYEQSEILWMKSELELLLACYHILQESGVSVAVISQALSREHVNIFLKTKSQLQNTYYKLRNGQMSVQTIYKQKPGRKRTQEQVDVSEDRKEKDLKKQNTEVIQQKNTEIENKKDLVQLLSGMINNFQVICDRNTNQKQLYQLIEGIYELSRMSAEQTKAYDEVEGLQQELSILKAENERLKTEKEELIQDIRYMTGHINQFIDSSDVEQLRGLSHFINTCRKELNKLGLYVGQRERKLRVIVDHSGQVLSVSD